jgi:hypothetical protein
MGGVNDKGGVQTKNIWGLKKCNIFTQWKYNLELNGSNLLSVCRKCVGNCKRGRDCDIRDEGGVIPAGDYGERQLRVRGNDFRRYTLTGGRELCFVSPQTKKWNQG